MRPVSPRFIACEGTLANSKIIVYGIPFVGRVNLRKGAEDGPRDLRLASDSVETYAPGVNRAPRGLANAHHGDRERAGRASAAGPPDPGPGEIAAWWRPGLIPFM